MTPLEEIIRREIEKDGPISFARFMELALYHPDYGYYERLLKQTGRTGDFYTSVSVGTLYGELLGYEFSQRLARLDAPALSLIEAGAHDGQLTRDLMEYLAEYQKEIFKRIEYVIIEPSTTRARRQFECLTKFKGKVRWAKNWEETGEFNGICFSNELLDAMPIHVFRWQTVTHRWTEWGIASLNGSLEWKPLGEAGENSNARKLLRRLPPEILNVLPDQFTIELSPEAVSWWLRAAHALQSGWLCTVDYGLLQDDFLQPHRSRGTLRAYSRHHLNTNLLDAVGEQDITAHVNFSLLIAAGESAGLKTDEFVHQGIFIKTILEKIERDPSGFPLWTPMRYRQLSSLIHPEHFGRAFKLLLQSRAG
ncbi:MAG TPA: SAM-dependent methyltransferase [Verrucomicrobiae bacterium]|nr:SAM-dependent methyltransferase [Verrucomicrobiae bacterium]